jgi:hypothetical protein
MKRKKRVSKWILMNNTKHIRLKNHQRYNLLKVHILNISQGYNPVKSPIIPQDHNAYSKHIC